MLQDAEDVAAGDDEGLVGFKVADEEKLQAKHPLIGEVRGKGLLLGVERVRDRATKEPAAAETNALLGRCREQRVLVVKGGLYGNVIRISPPMNIVKSDVDEFIRRLDAALGRIGG